MDLVIVVRGVSLLDTMGDLPGTGATAAGATLRLVEPRGIFTRELASGSPAPHPSDSPEPTIVCGGPDREDRLVGGLPASGSRMEARLMERVDDLPGLFLSPT